MIEFKTRKNDPSLMNAFQRGNSELTLQYLNPVKNKMKRTGQKD